MRLLLVLAGVALLSSAIAADQAWFLRHLLTLDSYGAPPLGVVPVVRGCAVALGALLLGVAWRARQSKPQRRSSLGAILRVSLAVGTALTVSELLLRRGAAAQHQERRTLHSLLGEPHPRYGWIFRPGSAKAVRLQDREVPLAFDADGSRIQAPGRAPDPSLPSLLIAGESVAMGHELLWEETFGALAARELSLEPVNLAVNGYGVDQAWLRLADLWPHHPNARALVMVVLPVQLGRNLIDDHPLLAMTDGKPGLVAPAAGLLARSRLRSLLVNQLPFRGEAAVQRTLELTRALLRDLHARARAAGTQALFVTTSPGPDRPLDDHPEAWLLHALYDGAGLPWILVDLGDAERFRDDAHPNPAGARKIAARIVAALRRPAARGH